MAITRRAFMSTTVAAGAAMGLGVLGTRRSKPMRILILGGTGFLGPHIVRRVVERGHEITLFNRGRTNTHLFPDLEKLHGDRDPRIGDGLKALEGRSWDAVVDTSGYVPRIASASATLLADRVEHYVFVSTVSVYRDHAKPGLDEDYPVGTIDDETSEEVSGGQYGPLKALCEAAVERAMPGRTASVRPGLIVGPGDPTNRFSYWPARVARGGEVLGPGDGGDPVQIIDARDLAAFLVLMMEQRTTGVFNATGPAAPMTMAQMLDACRDASGSDAAMTWVDADFLQAHGVSAWQDMPAWVPASAPGYGGFGSVSSARAIAAGLAFRPTRQTAADTLAWLGTLEGDRAPRFGEPDARGRPTPGLSAEREAELLKAWHERADEPQRTGPGAGG